MYNPFIIVNLKIVSLPLKFKNTKYIMENKVIESQEIENKEVRKTCKSGIFHIIGYGILAIAVIVLFILHFKSKPLFVRAVGDSQTIIVTINTDSIMEHFEYVKLMKNDLEEETEKYQEELATKSAAFETRYKNYMINVQNNALTQTQMQKAERELLQEKETLEALSAKYTKTLMDKEMSVNNEMTDSLRNASIRINEASFQANYIFAVSKGSAILYSNQMYDITNEVIKELNSAYKKSTK